MTLDEAIEKNKDLADDMEMKCKPIYAKAIKLGIEALELKQKLYGLYMNSIKWAEPASKLIKAPLPSETEGGI